MRMLSKLCQVNFYFTQSSTFKAHKMAYYEPYDIKDQNL